MCKYSDDKGEGLTSSLFAGGLADWDVVGGVVLASGVKVQEFWVMKLFVTFRYPVKLYGKER